MIKDTEKLIEETKRAIDKLYKEVKEKEATLKNLAEQINRIN